MATTDLEALKARINEQDEALAELAQSIARLGAIDVPASFYADLDEACTPPARTPRGYEFPFTFQLGLRA